MNNFLNKKIVDCVIAGIEKATGEYIKLTKGYVQLGNGPEYFLTVSIANELKQLDDASIFLEENHGDLQAPPTGKKLENWKPNGRYDIVVRDSKALPYAVIEVKHRVHKVDERVIKDFQRVASAVEPEEDGEIICNMGIFAFYSEIYGEQTDLSEMKKEIHERYNQLEIELNKHKGNAKLEKNLIPPNPYTNKNGKVVEWGQNKAVVWGGGCFILSPE